MAEFELRAIQGEGTVATVTFDDGAFQGTESLTATIGVGDAQAAILTLVPTWTAGQTTGAYSQADVALASTQTLALPWGVYNAQVSLADASSALAYGWLTIYPGPGGTAVPYWRSLASVATAVGYLPDLAQNKQDALPHALAAATRAIEAYVQRPLVLDSYDHFVRPQNTSRLRLRARPVVELTRCASGLNSAVQVTNTTATAATVNFVTTNPASLGVKSLVFTSTLSGVATTQTITVASYGTISLLTSAINALGNGWSATTASTVSDQASSEIIGTPGARDARTGTVDLFIASQPLSQYWLDPDHGTVEINQGFAGNGLVGNPRLERADSRNWGIRVTYRAGYAYLKADSDLGYYVVPEDLAAACITTANSILETAPIQAAVKSQTVKDRSYVLRDNPAVIPDVAKTILARYLEPTF